MTRQARTQFKGYAQGRLWSVPRIGLDLVFWAAAVAASLRVDAWWGTALAIAFIGAVPMHDLLVHGHEGTHRHLARNRMVNELFTWLVHALVGLSGTAYRAFHLAHHRHAQTARDPELQLLDRIAKGAPGWAYLAIPAVAHVAVNAYPTRQKASWRVQARVGRDLLGAMLLHAALAGLLGAPRYAAYVLAPIFTGLAAVVVLRSLCEHHGTPEGDAWTNTRTMSTGRLLEWIWSNTSYHLEHHLCPHVPFHRLPAVRNTLAREMQAHGSTIDQGFWRVAFALLRHPQHRAIGAAFQPAQPPLVDRRSLAFAMKVRWFSDLLASPAARRHLWQLYYAGEAYEELHPDAVFTSRLEPRLGRLLTRQLADETRHATVFRALLAEEGQVPAALPPTEDVGFFLLTHVLPELRAELGRSEPFPARLTQRYMAFLHALELRSMGDLEALRTAAERRGETALAHRLEDILRDEHFHARYTHRAVHELAAAGDPRAVLREVCRAERRSYREVLVAILQRFEALGARPRDRAGAWRWRAMKALARLGLAVPRLPHFDRFPAGSGGVR
jgi:fatty acid desaturase